MLLVHWEGLPLPTWEPLHNLPLGNPALLRYADAAGLTGPDLARLRSACGADRTGPVGRRLRRATEIEALEAEDWARRERGDLPCLTRDHYHGALVSRRLLWREGAPPGTSGRDWRLVSMRPPAGWLASPRQRHNRGPPAAPPRSPPVRPPQRPRAPGGAAEPPSPSCPERPPSAPTPAPGMGAAPPRECTPGCTDCPSTLNPAPSQLALPPGALSPAAPMGRMPLPAPLGHMAWPPHSRAKPPSPWG